MADPRVKTQEKPKAKVILPDTPEMEAHLGIGYSGLTVAEAEAIVTAHKENPRLYSIQEVRNAQAFLAAYHAKPEVVATRKMWQRPVTA